MLNIRNSEVENNCIIRWIIKKTINTVTDLLKALRNSGHAVPQRLTLGNSRDCATVGDSVLLGGRQRTNEMPG
jgi:hypothetical protein